MYSLFEELQGQTDLPIQVVGIHQLGESTNSRMFSDKSLAWLREDEANRPWDTWRVPVGSRPAQEVRWKDVVILDENNQFHAVQNLDNDPLSSGGNRDKLKNALWAAATLTDADLDGIPDKWEFASFGSIGPSATTTTATGASALVAYAFSQPALVEGGLDHGPVVSIVESGGSRYLQLEFRRRLGLEGERLIYTPERSADGRDWRSGSEAWVELGTSVPWDGTGTEVVSLRSADPLTSSPTGIARVRVTAPD